MKILVACEESQRVTIAFREKGHEAYSCDILPCSGGHPEYHLQQDVIPLLSEKFDMIIAFPPCTYLCNAGLHYSKKNEARYQLTLLACDFFMKFVNAACKKIAIENPPGFMNTYYRKPDQIINPFMFGTPERKRTCLWLKGLPLLQPTDIVTVCPQKTIIRKTGNKAGQPYNYYWRQGKSAKERSKTFKCVANAMADQWGNV